MKHPLAFLPNISIISRATSRSGSVIWPSWSRVRVPSGLSQICSSVGRATGKTPSSITPFVAPPNSSLAGRSFRVICHYVTPGALTHPHPSCGPELLGYLCKVPPSYIYTPTSLMGPDGSRLSQRYVGSNPIACLRMGEAGTGNGTRLLQHAPFPLRAGRGSVTSEKVRRCFINTPDPLPEATK